MAKAYQIAEYKAYRGRSFCNRIDIDSSAYSMQTAKENEACQRLKEIPGVGPVTATALIGAVGNASDFRKGRNLAAWMGIIPRECSTGGKQKLLWASVNGAINTYEPSLFRAHAAWCNSDTSNLPA